MARCLSTMALDPACRRRPLSNPVRSAARRVKVGVNFLLDRIIERADLVLMEFYRVPRRLRGIARWAARATGETCLFLREWPRASVYRLNGPGWAVVFVGQTPGLLAIRAALFGSSEVVTEDVGRVALWRVPGQISRWLREGTAVVVQETGVLNPWRSTRPAPLVVPSWVQQELALPARLDDLLTGRRYQGLVVRVEAAGHVSAFTRRDEDFEDFYDRLYVPFVRARHDTQALVTPCRDLRRWFHRGGLVLVRPAADAPPVAGMVCYVAGEVCYLVEAGLVLDTAAWQLGLNAFLWWSVYRWAASQGIRVVDLGGSRPVVSEGALAAKRRWGGRVVRRKRIVPDWVLSFDDLPVALRDRMDRLGWITRVNGTFCRAILPAEPPGPAERRVAVDRARRHGLAGVVLCLPGQKPELLPIAGDPVLLEPR